MGISSRSLGPPLRVLSSAPHKELKVLPLFTHCFCSRDLTVNQGVPLTQFTLAGCEHPTTGYRVWPSVPRPFLHSLSISSRLAQMNGPALENITISQRMLVLSCTQRKPGCTQGKLNEQLGETPWALHMERSRDLSF